MAILNKIDLLPYLDFDAKLAVANMHQVHPNMPVFDLSAKTGQGFEPWIEWLKMKVYEKTGKKF
jgi:hydrogenase nickel incorporation protein HypB